MSVIWVFRRPVHEVNADIVGVVYNEKHAQELIATLEAEDIYDFYTYSYSVKETDELGRKV